MRASYPALVVTEQLISNMAKREDNSMPARRKSQAGSGAQKTNAAFDLWLQRGLHEIFDGVAREPVPEEFLRLIEEDRRK